MYRIELNPVRELKVGRVHGVRYSGTMPLSKLQATARVGDQAYDALHTAIVTGEYEAGRRLQIRDLAADLGISVMPVREAIKRLEEVGLVETQPYRGAIVKELSRSELLQIYAVRGLLEIEAASLGAAHVQPEDIAKLHELYTQLREAIEHNDVIEYLNLDEEMLTIVYSASGNVVLMDQIRSLWDRCRIFKIMGARGDLSADIIAKLLEFQPALIEAVENGDSEAAAKVTEASIESATQRITVALEK